MSTSVASINKLKEGNQRYVSGKLNSEAASPQRRSQLVDGQAPFAIVLGCADSRVPVEMVFDQGVGDLFVIRVAGNIVDRTVAGSAEFAVAKLGCKLIVVLGHSKCGALQAALNEMEKPSKKLSQNLRTIVDAVQPALRTTMSNTPNQDPDTILAEAIQVNATHSVQILCNSSKILGPLVDAGDLTIIAAQYDLETGKVEWFDEVAK